MTNSAGRNDASDADEPISLKDLARSLRLPIIGGPWLLTVLGVGMVVYAMTVQNATAVTIAFLTTGAAVAVAAAVLPRAKRFRFSAKGVDADINTFTSKGPVVQEGPTINREGLAFRRRRKLGDRTGSGMTEHRGGSRPTAATVLDPQEPTLAQILAAAETQGWKVEWTNNGVRLVSPNSTYTTNVIVTAAAFGNPVAKPFLDTLRNGGLVWPPDPSGPTPAAT
jgi:hypothetical protein